MDDILSDLSFQIQHPVLICQLEVIDLTEPVQIGDTRECLLFRYPQGYKTPKFQLSNYIGNVEAIEQPELRTTDGSSKFSHALRWYVKGLAAQTDAAKFMFFWIALEILVTAAGEKVTLPYRAPCGHEILSCPECGKETQRRMGGAEIQRYLVDQFAISEEEAKKLWNFRQIMHGANRLTRQSIADLPGHTALCWSLAAAALKQAMGHRPRRSLFAYPSPSPPWSGPARRGPRPRRRRRATDRPSGHRFSDRLRPDATSYGVWGLRRSAATIGPKWFTQRRTVS
jgi:hypothetical protein